MPYPEQHNVWDSGWAGAWFSVVSHGHRSRGDGGIVTTTRYRYSTPGLILSPLLAAERTSHLHNVDLDYGYRSFISKELRPLFLPFCFSYALNRQSLYCLISFSYQGLDKSKIHKWLYLDGTVSASIFWCYPILPPKPALKWTWKLRQNIWHQVDPVAGKITMQQ